MNLTPLAFFGMAERHAKDQLPPLAPGEEWYFQRYINFQEHSGHLQFQIVRSGQDAQTVATVHARKTEDDSGNYLKGFLQPEGADLRVPFEVHPGSAAQLEEVLYALAERWVTELKSAQERAAVAASAPAGKKPAVKKKAKAEGS